MSLLVFYTLSYSVSLRVIRVGGAFCCVLHRHISPFTSWSSSFEPHRTLQSHGPCFTVFYTVSYSVSFRVFRLKEFGAVRHISSFTTLVKLFPPSRVTLYLVVLSNHVVPVLQCFMQWHYSVSFGV